MSPTISRFKQLLLLIMAIVIAMGPDSARAQGPAAYASTSVTAYVSASGVTTFGFAPPGRGTDTVAPIDALAILPAGSDIPPIARPLVEQMWRRSTTFRRQCARLKNASVAIVLSFDHPVGRVGSDAETEISRTAGLRAHIRLRGADRRTFELIAHEFEHILEQIDEIDLAVAVADGVHGARVVRKPAAFETRRAAVAGRAVAREIEAAEPRR
jgi:hypothetical protein